MSDETRTTRPELAKRHPVAAMRGAGALGVANEFGNSSRGWARVEIATVSRWHFQGARALDFFRHLLFVAISSWYQWRRAKAAIPWHAHETNAGT